MSDSPGEKNVIPAHAVRRVDHPVLVHCGPSDDRSGRTLTVVPLMDGERVAGLEIRCGCGAHAIVECVYREEVSR